MNPSQPVQVGIPEATPEAPAVLPPQNEPNKKKSKRTLFVILLASFCIGLLISAGSVLLWYRSQLLPKTKDDVYHVISVKPGESSEQIAKNLQQKQIIKSSTAFLWHIKLDRKTNLQAGSYRISSKLSTPEVASVIAEGKVSTLNVLIAPGLRLSQIEKYLLNAGYEQAEVDEALVAVRDHPLLKNVPKDTPLEGYLFPDTYKIGPDTTAEQLVRLMLDTLQAKITPEIIAGLKKQGLTVEEGVILASIVQKEVSDYPNMQKVAQVFLKRLNEGVVLGSDVTFQYAAKETGKAETPELDSPYNTRKVAGLPPSAIANFNIDALKAVADPASTDFLYFVAGDDGQVYYSNTEAEHEALTIRYCASCFQ